MTVFKDRHSEPRMTSFFQKFANFKDDLIKIERFISDVLPILPVEVHLDEILNGRIVLCKTARMIYQIFGFLIRDSHFIEDKFSFENLLPVLLSIH